MENPCRGYKIILTNLRKGEDIMISEIADLRTQLNNLFCRWQKVHENEEEWKNTTAWEDVVYGGNVYKGIEKDSFVRDGIVSDEYDYKTLFVLKEANIISERDNEDCLPHERNQVNWYKKFVESGRDNKPKQLEKIGRMYCALVNNNKSPDDFQIRNGLNRIAFMNLNKRGGGNLDKKVEAYFAKEEYKELITQQIHLLQPEFIICLGTYKWVKQLNLDNNKTYKTIDMWHTAYTRSEKLGYIDISKYMEEFYSRSGLNN